MLLDYLDRCFPVDQYEVYLDDEGNEQSRPLMVDGERVANPEAVERREEMKTLVASALIPESPLEMLLEHFGPERVAEVTGRRRRVVRRTVDGVPKRVIEERNPHVNQAEIAAFMSGKKEMLIF